MPKFTGKEYTLKLSDELIVAAYRLYNSSEPRAYSIDHSNREDASRLCDYLSLVSLGRERKNLRDLPEGMRGIFCPFFVGSRLRKLRKDGLVPTRKRMIG